MNKEIEKLQKIEKQVKKIAASTLIIQPKFEKALNAAQNTPEWEAYCETIGMPKDYDFRSFFSWKIK